jgi:hypothetical protein
MSLWTPGPWIVVEAAYGSKEFAWVESQGEGEPVICGVFTRLPGEISVEDRSNVNLIAAAPELYDACDEVRRYLDQMVDKDRDRLDRDYGAPPIDALMAALAKARGETEE